MNYQVNKTSKFLRHLHSLPTRLNISREEANLATEEITTAIEILEDLGTLPDQYGYQLHTLDKEPWKGRLEFHALDDVLVIYAEIISKNVITLIGIYNHELLSSGRLD